MDIFQKEAAAICNAARIQGGTLGTLSDAIGDIEMQIKLAPANAKNATLVLLAAKSTLCAVAKVALENRHELEELRNAYNRNLAEMRDLADAMNEMRGSFKAQAENVLIDVGVIAPRGEEDL